MKTKYFMVESKKVLDGGLIVITSTARFFENGTTSDSKVSMGSYGGNYGQEAFIFIDDDFYYNEIDVFREKMRWDKLNGLESTVVVKFDNLPKAQMYFEELRKHLNKLDNYFDFMTNEIQQLTD